MSNCNRDCIQEISESISYPVVIVNSCDIAVTWANDIALQRYPSLKMPGSMRLLLGSEQAEQAIDYITKGRNIKLSACIPPLSMVEFQFVPFQCDEDGLYDRAMVFFTDKTETTAPLVSSAGNMILSFSNQYRTPLSNIFAALGPLERAAEEMDNPVYSEYLKHISKNCYQMLRTTATLAEVAKFTNAAGSLSLKQGDLTDFISTLCEAVHILIRPTEIRFEYSVPAEPIYTLFDPDRLTTAILHLISNSCSFTRDYNFIRLSLETIEDRAVITVADKGAGIPSEYITRIFDPYFSYEQGGARFSRSGLGLTLVKHIVYAHAGTIYVNSVEGEGTVVAFTLPVTDDPDAPRFLKTDASGYLRDTFSPLYIGLADIGNFYF